MGTQLLYLQAGDFLFESFMEVPLTLREQQILFIAHKQTVVDAGLAVHLFISIHLLQCRHQSLNDLFNINALIQSLLLAGYCTL